MRLTNTAKTTSATKLQSPETMARLLTAISSPESGPALVASALLRHVQAITPVKPGSTWHPTRGLKVRYGVTLEFPSTTMKIAATKGASPALYRAYEECARIANLIAARENRPIAFGEAESNGRLVFDAMVEEGTFEACGYEYPDGSGRASIRFAGEGSATGVTRAPATLSLDDLGI